MTEFMTAPELEFVSHYRTSEVLIYDGESISGIKIVSIGENENEEMQVEVIDEPEVRRSMYRF